MIGQLKSRLDCPSCKRVSITFDPFMFLSVPLPTVVDKVQEVAMVFADPNKQISMYGTTVSTVGRIADLKKSLSELTGVPTKRMLVADVWHHRVYRFLEDDAGISDIRSNDHIYVYEVPGLEDIKDPVPVQLVMQKMERNAHWIKESEHSKEFNCEVFGLPRAFALPRKNTLGGNDVKKLVDRVLEPCKANNFPSDQGPQYKILTLQSDGRNCLKCGYSKDCAGCVLPADDVPVDNGDGRESKASFAIQWQGDLSTSYKLECEKEGRDKSADASLTTKEERVDISDCIKAFTHEETLSEQDPWYCSECKEFRQARKKFDLWKLPNILIIHLKRFSYTRMWRDKISTLVDFPLSGLDMSSFCGNSEYKDNAIYDCYGVSNHMGGLGGGHYTAYCKNLADGNWYCHDDSRVSRVNVNEIKSSSAYVLFYARRTKDDTGKLKLPENVNLATSQTSETTSNGSSSRTANPSSQPSGAGAHLLSNMNGGARRLSSDDEMDA
jgi:ubiquitin carboxyl-terminal hydrolase 4/11/15